MKLALVVTLALWMGMPPAYAQQGDRDSQSADRPSAPKKENAKRDGMSEMRMAPAPKTGSMPTGPAPSGKLGTEPVAKGKLGTDPKPGDPKSRPPRFN
jgi:hypothetical protein